MKKADLIKRSWLLTPCKRKVYFGNLRNYWLQSVKQLKQSPIEYLCLVPAENGVDFECEEFSFSQEEWEPYLNQVTDLIDQHNLHTMACLTNGLLSVWCSKEHLEEAKLLKLKQETFVF